jgi:hypothetical protein
MPRMKYLLDSLVLFAVFLPLSVLEARAENQTDPQDISDRVIQAHQTNQLALINYTWHQRTEIIKDGATASTKPEVVRYDSNGNEQRTMVDQMKPGQKKENGETRFDLQFSGPVFYLSYSF